MESLKKSAFTDYFLEANDLETDDFKEWLLCDGMLFNSSERWWGDRAKRKNPHEGLDLVLYSDGNNSVTKVSSATKIPIMFDGIVVGIFDDFLGKSIFVTHPISDSENRKLCTIFGHTDPASDLYVGKMVKAGEVVGRVANAGKSKVGSHLHITIGWAQRETMDDLLDWKMIGDSQVMKLINPLDLIGSYAIVPASTLFPE